MRRVSLIALCLLVAGAAGGTTGASAHHHTQRYKLCQEHRKRTNHRKHHKCSKHHRRSKHHKRWGLRQHRVGQISHSVSQTSAGPATALPRLAELIAPETVCPGQSDLSLSFASQEATMGCMINFARSKAGDVGLAAVAALNDSSDHKASDIIQCDDFSHTACGRAFTYWFQQDGYVQAGGCSGAGENIAWGTGELGTIRSILSGWVYSPDHLANMLTASFDQFGVGLEIGQLNGYPDAHVWVTHFGTDC
jgi:uncharacterized protein YkwD